MFVKPVVGFKVDPGADDAFRLAATGHPEDGFNRPAVPEADAAKVGKFVAVVRTISATTYAGEARVNEIAVDTNPFAVMTGVMFPAPRRDHDVFVRVLELYSAAVKVLDAAALVTYSLNVEYVAAGARPISINNVLDPVTIK
jgi:hypothetical protein